MGTKEQNSVRVCYALHDLSHRHCLCGCYRQAWRQHGPGGNVHHTDKPGGFNSGSPNRPPALPAGRNNLYHCVQQDSGQSVSAPDTTLPHCMVGPMAHAAIPQLGGFENESELLSVEHFPHNSHTHEHTCHNPQRMRLTDTCRSGYCIHALLHIPVRDRQDYRAQGKLHDRGQPGARPEEHRVRYMDGLHFLEPSGIGCGRILHHLA